MTLENFSKEIFVMFMCLIERSYLDNFWVVLFFYMFKYIPSAQVGSKQESHMKIQNLTKHNEIVEKKPI